MTRLHLLLGLACVTGAAATVASASPQRPPAPLPAASVAPAASKVARPDGQDDQAWLAGFGKYNLRKGSWSTLLNSKGC